LSFYIEEDGLKDNLGDEKKKEEKITIDYGDIRQYSSSRQFLPKIQIKIVKKNGMR
jgi:hypothetical protein